MAERPNFYELLELDPSVDAWDEIEKVIAGKRNRWNNDRTHLNQARKRKAEEGLKYVDEMRKVLGDPVTRRREQAARRAQLAEKRRAREEELERLIGKIRARGAGCDRAQFQLLVEKFDGVFTPLEIEKRLAAAGIRVGEEQQGEAPSWERKAFISDVLAEDVRRNLEICGSSDLYAFLGADPRTPAAELEALADRRYKQGVRVGRTDEIATAEQKLAGICQTLFKSEAEKEKYDNYLRTLPMRELHDDVDLAGASKKFRQSDLDELASQARARGVEEADAYAFLLWYAEERGWELVQPSPEEEARARAKRHEEEMKEAAEVVRKAAEEAKAEAERLRQERERTERERKRAEGRPTAGPPPPPPPPVPPLATPLPAPDGLRVERRGDGFRLLWQPVPSARGPVSYCVVRKAASPPTDEGDGEFVSDDLPATHFEDSRVSKHTPWYYAVYAVRGGEVSERGAASGPHRIKGAGAWKLAVAAMLLIAVMGGAYAWRISETLKQEQLQEEQKREEEKRTKKEEEQKKEEEKRTKKEEDGDGDGEKPKVGGRVSNPGTAHVPPPFSLPKKPRVTVIAVGDPGLAPTVERCLAQKLRPGLDVVNRGNLLRLDDLARRRRGNPEVLDVLSVLKQESVHVLVRAEIRHVGQRELRYFGKTSIATTSSLNVNVFLVAEQRGMGSGWSEQFEYTSINVSKQVENAVGSMSSEVINAVESGWSSYRRGVRKTRR